MHPHPSPPFSPISLFSLSLLPPALRLLTCSHFPNYQVAVFGAFDRMYSLSKGYLRLQEQEFAIIRQTRRGERTMPECPLNSHTQFNIRLCFKVGHVQFCYTSPTRSRATLSNCRRRPSSPYVAYIPCRLITESSRGGAALGSPSVLEDGRSIR